MVRQERDILERAVQTLSEQAAKADELVDEAAATGGGDHPVTIHAKMLRLELLKVKADLERELEDFVPTARSAASTFIGSAASGSRPAIGPTGNQRRTASQRCRWIGASKGRYCPSGPDRDLAGTGPDLDVVPLFDLVVVGAPPVGLAAG
jgi:hypothetical protein